MRVAWVAVMIGLAVLMVRPAVAAVSLAEVERWLKDADLKYVAVRGDDGSVTHYVIPFQPEKSKLERIDVVVQLATDRQDFLVVWAKLVDLGQADAKVYRRLLEANGGLHIARFAVVEGGIYLLYDWPAALLSRDWFLSMVYDAAQLVDNNYDDLEALVSGGNGRRSSGTPPSASPAPVRLRSRWIWLAGPAVSR